MRNSLFLYKINFINLIKIIFYLPDYQDIYFYYYSNFIIKLIVDLLEILSKKKFINIKYHKNNGDWFADTLYEKFDKSFFPYAIAQRFMKKLDKYEDYKIYDTIFTFLNKYSDNKKWLIRYYIEHNHEEIFRLLIFIIYARFLKRKKRLDNYRILIDNSFSYLYFKKLKNTFLLSNVMNNFFFSFVQLILLNFQIVIFLIIKLLNSLLNKVFFDRFYPNNSFKIGVQHCWGFKKNRSDLYWHNDNFDSNKLLIYSDRNDRKLSLEDSQYLTSKNIIYLNIKSNFIKNLLNFKKKYSKIWSESPFIYLQVLIEQIKFNNYIFKHYKKNIFDTNDIYITNKLIYSILFWKSFFIQNNIVINLNHSGDGSTHHVIQSIAMDLSNGINTKDTYSYSSQKTILYAREFHVYFQWGFQPFCSKDTEENNSIYKVITGYPFDYLFYDNKKTIDVSKENEFVISLFDTTISAKFIKKFYKSFFDFLISNSNFTLNIKTKRNYNIIDQFLILEKFRHLKHRINIIDNETLPSQICQNSDLSVCLSINSAGIDIGLSGKNVIYWVPNNYIKCNQLNREKLVYNNLNQIIDIFSDDTFPKNIYDKNIGNHENLKNNLNPFIDKKSNYRIYNFYTDFLNYYEKSNNSHKALDQTINKYKIVWGNNYIE